MSIIGRTEHIETVCKPGAHDDGRYCMFCDGGLYACSACGCFEGMMARDCPRRPLTAKQGEDVYAGLLDYRDGQWVDAPSEISPFGRQRARNQSLGEPCERCGASWIAGTFCTPACHQADVTAVAS